MMGYGRDKSWDMPNWVWGVIMGVVLLFVLSGLIGGWGWIIWG